MVSVCSTVYLPWRLCNVCDVRTLIMYFTFLASQTWLLGRLVPFLVGEQVPEDDRHWQNYLLLLQILDLLLAPEITVDEVSHLNTLIPEHHSEFVNIYPDSSVIPKLHYLIHTPRLILKLVHRLMNCIRKCGAQRFPLKETLHACSLLLVTFIQVWSTITTLDHAL